MPSSAQPKAFEQTEFASPLRFGQRRDYSKLRAGCCRERDSARLRNPADAARRNRAACGCRLPARRPIAIASHRVQRGGVESQTGDDGKGVTVARIDRDPFSADRVGRTFGKPDEFVRRLQDPGRTERVGNGARTIVTGILKGTVAAAETVGLVAQLVRGPDGALSLPAAPARERCATPPRKVARVPGTTGPVVGKRRRPCDAWAAQRSNAASVPVARFFIEASS